MGQTDLHMHSSVSIDGDISPRGLAELCCQEGVTLAALTDHNDIAGVAEFIWRSAQLGVRAIPGIELDCMYETYNLHILGYGIDIADPLLLRAIREARGLLAEAGLRLMGAVEALGIRFDREHVLAQAKHGVICAEMIAEAALKLPENHMHPLIRPLLPGGTLADQPLVNFYWSVCAPGKPAYVPVEYMTAGQAIDLIHIAGGIAVLAHPGVSIKEHEVLDRVLCLPLDGIEVFSSYHTPVQAVSYWETAKVYHLLATGGSDFHGKTKPDIRLGGVDWQNKEHEITTVLLAELEQAHRV